MKIIYIDMDGCLAMWKRVPAWVTRIPLYFLFLKPERKLIRLVKDLIRDGYDVRILTKAYGRGPALEKRLWKVLMGLYKIPIIIVPYGKPKTDYVQRGGVLVDDFTPNLVEWEEIGTGIKFRNGINGTKGRWKGPSISNEMTVREMRKIVLQYV